MFRMGHARGVRERQAGVRAARRDLQRVANDTIREIIDRRIVPTAEGMTPSIVKGTMRSGASAKGGYLTSSARGKKRSITFLLNFGGTVSVPIVPRARKRGRKAALKFRTGNVIVAKVTGPRSYTGKHWMEKAVALHRGSVRIAISREVPAAVQAHIDKGG